MFIDIKEVIAIVEENIKELRSHLEQEQTIRKKMTMQISSIVRQNEGILCTTTVLFNSCVLCDVSDILFLYIEMRKMKERTIKDLTSLVKTKEGKQSNTSAITSPILSLSVFYIVYLHSILFSFYIKQLRRIYCQCLLRDRKS